ncbi:hypothetical protein DFH07DRAFT_1000691 [Mycena maculata]|uniref:Uncharacterized protein n=1 Tax=Mycena maculata TaxID=230809 RepID=A0AAD7HSS5_9AGAR|nr:hypothetical protein DFH07DRAFT_1000691 [Mycena maculata]
MTAHPTSTHLNNPHIQSISVDAQLSSLQEFLHEAFTQLVISPNDAFSAAALKHFWSPHVQAEELDTTATTELSRAGFGKAIQGLREQLTDRVLTKETFVFAAPADPTNRTGALAAHPFHTHTEPEESWAARNAASRDPGNGFPYPRWKM